MLMPNLTTIHLPKYFWAPKTRKGYVCDQDTEPKKKLSAFEY